MTLVGNFALTTALALVLTSRVSSVDIPVGSKVYADPNNGARARANPGSKDILYTVNGYTVGTIKSGKVAGVPIEGQGTTTYDWYLVDWDWPNDRREGYSATAAFVYRAPLAPGPESPGTESQNSPEVLDNPTVTFRWSPPNDFEAKITTDYQLNVRDLDLPADSQLSNYPLTRSSMTLQLIPGHHYKWNVFGNNGGLRNDVAVSFWFNIKEANYSVTSSAGEGGKVTPSGVQSIRPGGTLVFGAIADDGYEFDGWLINGSRSAVTAPELSLQDVEATTAVQALFKATTVTLTVEATTPGGGVSVSVAPAVAAKAFGLRGPGMGQARSRGGSTFIGQYRKGASVALSAVADPGFQFSQWRGEVQSVADTVSITLLHDTRIELRFVQNPFSPTLSYSQSTPSTVGIHLVVPAQPAWRQTVFASYELPNWFIWSSSVSDNRDPVGFDVTPPLGGDRIFVKTEVEAANDIGGFLDFPLDGSPYTFPVTAVFDNGNPGKIDGSILLFSGKLVSGAYYQKGQVATKRPSGDADVERVEYALPADAIPKAMLKYVSTLLSYDGHTGYDYPCEVGTAVRTAAAGKIAQKFDEKWGQLAVEHPQGYTTYYLHLSKPQKDWQVGDSVGALEQIGESGKTAPYAINPHLHFTVKKNCETCRVDPYGLRDKDGNVVRPVLWKQAPPASGVIAH